MIRDLSHGETQSYPEASANIERVTAQRDKLKTICLNIVERGLAASDIHTLRDVIAEIEAAR